MRHQNYILVGYHLATISLNVTSSTYSRIQTSKAATSKAHQWDSQSVPPISYFQTHIINSSHNIVLQARLHDSPRLINTVESTKVNRVNSSFERKWSTGLTGEQAGDGQLSFNVVDFTVGDSPQITRINKQVTTCSPV